MKYLGFFLNLLTRRSKASLGLGGGPSILMRYGDICEIFRFLFEIPNKKVFSEIRLRRTVAYMFTYEGNYIISQNQSET